MFTVCLVIYGYVAESSMLSARHTRVRTTKKQQKTCDLACRSHVGGLFARSDTGKLKFGRRTAASDIGSDAFLERVPRVSTKGTDLHEIVCYFAIFILTKSSPDCHAKLCFFVCSGGTSPQLLIMGSGLAAVITETPHKVCHCELWSRHSRGRAIFVKKRHL